MRFPDYFFFAEKRLVSHEIETKYVKDLDHWAFLLHERQLRQC